MELDRTEEKLETAKLQLSSVLEDHDCMEKTMKELEFNEQDHSDRLDLQTEELRNARAVAEDADRKYDEISRKLMMMEGEFDEAEKLNDSLKVYEQMEEKLGDRENEMDAELFSLKSQLRDSEYQREEAEKEVQKLEKTCDGLQKKLEEVQAQKENIQKELDQLIAELDDL